MSSTAKQQPQRQCLTQTATKRRKFPDSWKNQLIDTEQEKTRILSSSDVHDADLLFFKSCLPFMKKMPADDDRNSLSNNTGSDTLTIQEYQKWYVAHNLPHDDDMPKDQQDTALSAEFQGIDTCGEDEGDDTNLEIITAKRRTKSMVDECALHGEDQQTLMAECRACNIRLKPQVADGVYLTCFECRSMPVDQTCKLGVHDKENPRYRVSASFFEVLVQNTTDTHESSEEEEEQHSEDFIAY